MFREKWGMPVCIQASLSLFGPGLVAMALAKHQAAMIPLRLESVSEISTPNETVTVVIDRASGVMEIYAEHNPAPEDWEAACDLIRELCSTEDIGEPDYLKGVDTFRVKLKT